MVVDMEVDMEVDMGRRTVVLDTEVYTKRVLDVDVEDDIHERRL